MLLNFIGNGSAFNVTNGNTSAFYREGDKFLLLDCGETVMERIIKSKLLDGVNKIYIANTHLHGDHAGSLSSFIYYSFYAKGIVPRIVASDYPLKDKELATFLQFSGTNKNFYSFCGENLENEFWGIKSLKYNKVSHDNKITASYAINITMADGKKIYFSGDTNDFEYIKAVGNALREGDEFYCDTCFAEYEGNVHCNIHRLAQAIPEEKRGQVYSMHLDNNNELLYYINYYGFKLAENIDLLQNDSYLY